MASNSSKHKKHLVRLRSKVSVAARRSRDGLSMCYPTNSGGWIGRSDGMIREANVVFKPDNWIAPEELPAVVGHLALAKWEPCDPYSALEQLARLT